MIESSLPIRKIWPIGAFIIVVFIIWNTNVLFQKMKSEERLKMQLWVMAQKEFVENKNINTLTFEVLQQTGTNPMFQVNSNGEIVDSKNIDNSIKIDSVELYKSLERIKNENKPISIKYRDSLSGKLLVDQKLFYGDSSLLKKLQYYPLALMLIIILFVLLLFFIFKTNKILEQNRLWAAMAKETAHQIGTPLSSLIGWLALIKNGGKPELSINEMENDIERLKTITERFSKIGSNPILETKNVVSLIKETVNYIKKRSSKLVNFNITSSNKSILLPINDQLISWTLENIIKNGIDAIKGKGVISIYIEKTNTGVKIILQDSGSGIKKEHTNKIFNPGFTTKKRGWGLGLSLARRIIKDYHKGNLYIKETSQIKGTTFIVELFSKVKN